MWHLKAVRGGQSPFHAYDWTEHPHRDDLCGLYYHDRYHSEPFGRAIVKYLSKIWKLISYSTFATKAEVGSVKLP